MNKKLIERLRDHAYMTDYEPASEAADEIERLEFLLRDARDEATHWLEKVHQVRDDLAAAQAREAKYREALQKCIDGFEYTRQYVGYEMLPAIDGWSWFDAVVAAKETLAQTEVK